MLAHVVVDELVLGRSRAQGAILLVNRMHRFHPMVNWSETPNAGAHLLPEAGATQERRLEAVRCSAWLEFFDAMLLLLQLAQC